MVTPTKQPLSSGSSYSALPTSNPSPDPNLSPNPNGSRPTSAYLSPEMTETSMMRRGSDFFPAPSIQSRDSTYDNLLATPNMGNDSRSSWGSAAGLAGAAGGIAGAEHLGRPAGAPRGQSNLAHSTLGWNNVDNDRISTDEEDGQGHIAPASAVIGAGTGASAYDEKTPRWAENPLPPAKKSRKWLWAGLGVAALLLIALAVGLGVGLTRHNGSRTASGGSSANDNAGNGSTGSSPSGTGTATATGGAATPSATTGVTGSLVTLEDGSTMTYESQFGGSWVWDEANPFNNEAKVNSWTPSLSQNWTWGVDKVQGVNLGGWLNTEPFIVPGLYEKYARGGSNNQTAVDEYTLSQNMGDNQTAALTEHYETFITERDFAAIAAAGLNWVRIPLAHWAIETWPGEPYLERVSWAYFLKAIKWARKYGIRINLDFHTIPGSQNGWNHSGHLGQVNFLNGVMGQANAERALNYLRTLAQFISQPEYAPVIQYFGFINEPNANAIGKSALGSFYLEAYNVIREVTGFGEGNGPMLGIHDGFLGPTQWFGFLEGADRIAMDQHTYMVFGNQPTGTFDQISKLPCQYWGASTNTLSKTFGVNNAGEWSAASNDCGKWLNNVGAGSRYNGTYAGYTGPTPGSCDYWNDYTQWNESTKADILHFTLASMDALQNYFFWTWKIGDSTGPIAKVNPFWNYQLGLANGWITPDPRNATGTCTSDGVTFDDFSGTYPSPYMTGGAGANQIAATESQSYPWPPASFTSIAADDMTNLPQYTQTGTPITMPAATFTSPGSTATIDAGSGWFKAEANQAAFAPVSGCTYPSEYFAAELAVPTAACGAGIVQPTRRALPTPAPKR